MQVIFNNDELCHDGIALAADSPGVIRDANGVPVEWTVLRTGANPTIKNGVPGSINIDQNDMASILDYFAAKGEDIPIDSCHYLHYLATSKKLDEAEVAKMIPSGVAALGYGSLALSGDELRVKVNWKPTAYELMKEGIYKYFSPGIRGLVNPPLRLTSIAMENEPAINNLDALTASANNRAYAQKKGLQQMTKLEQALAKLIRRDSLALAADGTADDVATAVEAKANLLAEVRKALQLGEDVSDDVIMTAIASILAKAETTDSLRAEITKLSGKVDTMAASADAKLKSDLISQGERDGKIVPANKPWFEKLDHVALASYLPTAPVIVAPGKLTTKLPDDADSVALTAEDKAAADYLGVTHERFLEQKKKGKR